MYKIPLQDFREQLRLRAAPVEGMNVLVTGEESIPQELAQMNREKQEKKLLEYQIKVKKGDINSFLASKYADGTFNEAKYDGYDNSKTRLENGITFDYHVYFDRIQDRRGEDKYAGQRPATEYLLTNPIFSPVGDRYTYHIPVHYTDDFKTEIATDIDDELVDNSSRSISQDGLVYALQLYKDNVKSGRNQFDNKSYNALRRHGFIRDGKFDGAIPGKIVEKYLLNINETKRHNAILYLNQEFENVEEEKKEESPPEDEEDEDDELPAPAPEPEPSAPAPRSEQDPVVKQKNVMNKKEFERKIDLISSLYKGKIENLSSIGHLKFNFQKDVHSAYLPLLKEVEDEIISVIDSVTNEDYDEDNLKEALDPFIEKAKELNQEARDQLAEETKKRDDVVEHVIEKFKATDEWTAEGLTYYKKWERRIEKYPDLLKEKIKEVMKKTTAKTIEDFKSEITEAAQSLVDEVNTEMEQLEKWHNRIVEWETLQTEFEDLKEKDPAAKIDTSVKKIATVINAADKALQELKYDKVEAVFKRPSASAEQFNSLVKSLELQKKMSNDRLSKVKRSSPRTRSDSDNSDENVE